MSADVTTCSCPSCSNTGWKLASLVYAEGAYAINLQTKGASVGVGNGGLNVGVNSSTSQGVNISALAKRAEPPQNQIGDASLGVGLIGAVIGAAIGFFNDGFLGLFFCVFFGMLVGSFAGMIFFWKSANEQYSRAMANYQKIRMCTRCGHFYLPEIRP
jgi:F0F1-type ATP synthase assembly protein I